MLDSMPVTIMAKNYSHCPLKKRPVHIFNDEPDEPENLSTKPQDLSRTGRLASVSPPSSLSEESPPISPASSIKSTRSPSPPIMSSPSPSPSPPAAASLHHPFYSNLHSHSSNHHQQKQLPVKVEPVELSSPRLPSYPPPISPEYAPQTWHRSVAPLYPPPYHLMPYPHHHYSSQHHHQDYMVMGPTSPYSDSSSLSPPHHTSSLHHHHHHQQPLQPLALRPTMYSSIDQSSLSPSSSTNTSPPPPSASSPEDLSEKRRQQGVRHQCPDCGKSYSTFSGLSKHRQFHCAAGEGPKKSFSCKYCEKVYVSLGALKMHIRTHTLPCKCTICGKAFSRPWLLQGHIRTHTGEKPFSCTYCNRAFADRSNLRAHLQTHSDVKKYSCPSCSKTFSRMSLLTKHAEGGCNGSVIHSDKIY